jgi:catechol 2,3-dioxygenase-like lactoylglutathione lyase family enzyme
MIQRLNHSAYRCRDSEETRRFYEELLGLPLVAAFELSTTKTGRATRALHTLYAMADGSCLAFFEVPDQPFDFKEQHDFDLHIALEVDSETLDAMLEKGRRAGVEARGVSDHGSIRSIYLRDPNGYVIELATRVRPRASTPADARATLDRWQDAQRRA